MPAKYVHTNLIAKNWRQLSAFYQEVFGCIPIPPKRELSGEWIDKATGLIDVHITGEHLLLPGYGDAGPSLEIFSYEEMPERVEIAPNTPGFGHIAFSVDDLRATVKAILELGGSIVGKLTVRDIPGAGAITFQYLTDPEGNIVEIQKWEKTT